jgi:myo-inositol-1-phosphate synthase
MSPELKNALEAEARRAGSNVNDVVVRLLAEALRVPYKSHRRKDEMASTNGSTNAGSRAEDKVRVAIIGVGNCANSFVQGLAYYRNAPADEFVPGLMHVDLGGYHVRDVELCAAFDVTTDKVGKDVADAIWAHPNDTYRFAEVAKTGVKVSRGMTHDGIGKYLADVVEKAPGETDDVVGILRETATDVVVNYLPVGSEEATKWYTEQILAAGCAMVNCMPVFIAREPYWQRRFQQAGVPIVGDDVKSQVGATITHRVLTSLFRERGIKLERTMQLNVGGNSDFLNMLERDRLESKKISKTNAVTSMLDYELAKGDVHVGPSDHVPWLTDRKWAYIRMEGSAFGDVPLNLELKLEVWDSPNSAGIVIDAVRLAKLALNNRLAGALEGPSAYLMKSPPKQIVDDEAHELVEQFVKKHARARAKSVAKV